jgi:hypothetical protein
VTGVDAATAAVPPGVSRSPSPAAPAAMAAPGASGSGEAVQQQEGDGGEGDCVMTTVVVIRTKPAVPGAWVCGLGSGLVAYVGWTLRCWEGVSGGPSWFGGAWAGGVGWSVEVGGGVCVGGPTGRGGK